MNPYTPDMDAKFRVITYNFTDFVPDLDIAGFFTTTETAQCDPELVEKFRTAMEKSLEFAQQNSDEVRGSS